MAAPPHQNIHTVAGRAAKAKEKELEKWLRGLDGMDRLVEDYGGQIPLWEKIMDRQGSVCCVWEKTAFEEGLKVGIRVLPYVSLHSSSRQIATIASASG